MRREHLLARLLRAVSGKTQEQLAEATGIHPVVIAQIETGKSTPRRDQLARMARCASIQLADAEKVLELYETFRRERRREGAGVEGLLDEMTRQFEASARAAHQRLLRLPLPAQHPRAEDRGQAAEQWNMLAELPTEARLTAVQAATELQSWALCERVCHECERQASGSVEEAAALARLAKEIAEGVRGPEGWRSRVQGYAAAQEANVLRVAGDLKSAEASFAEAKSLWHAGSDPEGLLDRGRLLDLEASLRRAQRRFGEAMALLDEAASVSRCPGRILINKGFTLEAIGEYERAVEVLFEALPLVEAMADPRLRNILDFNLAVNLCHLGRCAEAAELTPRVSERAREDGDKLALVRLTWLDGRIAAGLGRPQEGLQLLQEARQGFAAEGMSYDVVLALLEEAVLLLDLGRAAEVEELAQELAEAFESKGVHREALAALRLFHEAVAREEATAGLARQVLQFLFRARHDPELQFPGCH